ncbi:hypothetical protein [Chryseobacterium rhizoplanae]|uniref:hypothetical protein n=1 Tax=Chryseobacterium rhizoplanae TaxID=1609531 RepID=UPI001629CC8C|nr:hypothetical protein [Chryseobacterium rhizoplanae]
MIEGKIIKHFRHFRLQQSARRHHNFELILAHDFLGETQNHTLEQARQFLVLIPESLPIKYVKKHWHQRNLISG